MSKGNSSYNSTVAERVKLGKPRTSKIFKKKGNAASRTSKKGNGSRVRDIFGKPKNRSKTWDIKKSRDPKKDRRKTKRDLDGETKTTL